MLYLRKKLLMFGDIRLDNVLSQFLIAMTTRLCVILRKLGDTRTEEICFGRFINNSKVTPDKLVASLSAQSAIHCNGQHILFVNDTTSASFGLSSNRGNLGYVGSSSTISGFYMHPALAISANTGACLGLFGLKVWKRPAPIEEVYNPELSEKEIEALKKVAKKARRHIVYQTPFEDKESHRWLSVVQNAVQNCPNAARYTAVGDRESDIYEAMSGFKQSGLDFVIRSSKDRTLSTVCESEELDDDKKVDKKLFQTLNECEVSGVYNIELPKTDHRSAHTARVSVKFCPLSLKCPTAKNNGQYLPELPVYTVQIEEYPDTVVNNEKPIHWILLTSHPVESLEQALEIVKWYRFRWIIEQTFRTLKSKGLNIEDSQVETYEALINLATLALIAAVQVMQLVQARDGKTMQDIQSVFSPIEIQCLEKLNTELEGKTQKQKNPYLKNSLSFASWVIARLGGWSGYDKQRPAGPITMRDGIIRFYNILLGFKLNPQIQYVNELV
jgi:Transposase DDE domain